MKPLFQFFHWMIMIVHTDFMHNCGTLDISLEGIDSTLATFDIKYFTDEDEYSILESVTITVNPPETGSSLSGIYPFSVVYAFIDELSKTAYSISAPVQVEIIGPEVTEVTDVAEDSEDPLSLLDCENVALEFENSDSL